MTDNELMNELLRADKQIKALVDALAAVRDHPETSPAVRELADAAIQARFGVSQSILDTARPAIIAEVVAALEALAGQRDLASPERHYFNQAAEFIDREFMSQSPDSEGP